MNINPDVVEYSHLSMNILLSFMLIGLWNGVSECLNSCMQGWAGVFFISGLGKCVLYEVFVQTE